MGFFLHPSVSRRVLFGQAIVPPFLALNANHGAVGHLLVGSPVERDPRRKAGRRAVPDQLNTGDSLATWPLPNCLEAFVSQAVIRDCSSIELDHVAAPASLLTAVPPGS